MVGVLGRVLKKFKKYVEKMFIFYFDNKNKNYLLFTILVFFGTPTSRLTALHAFHQVPNALKQSQSHFATNYDFLMRISLQPYVVNLRYFKLLILID